MDTRCAYIRIRAWMYIGVPGRTARYLDLHDCTRVPTSCIQHFVYLYNEAQNYFLVHLHAPHQSTLSSSITSSLPASLSLPTSMYRRISTFISHGRRRWLCINNLMNILIISNLLLPIISYHIVPACTL